MRKYFFLLLLTMPFAEMLGQVSVTDSLALDSIETMWEKMIDEVTVVGHKPVVKFTTDKVNYRVKDDPDSKTQTVLEMLRKVPMVTVDGKSNISVNGSQQFLVYVDGRPSTMITRNPTKVLRSMPAGSVERIEVVTNPGAKYDAEGVGGVLNIITKKSNRRKHEELSGTSHTTIGTCRWGQDFMLNYAKNKWTVDMSLIGEYEYQGHSPMSSSIENLSGTPYTESSYMDTRQHMPFGMGELNIGYQVDSVSAVHLALSGTHMAMNEEGSPTYYYKGGQYGDGLALTMQSESKMRMESMDGSLDYQRFFGQDKEGCMTFTYQYSLNPVHMINRYNYYDKALAEQFGYFDINQESTERSENHNVLADFVLPVANWLKINTGTKYTADINQGKTFNQQRHLGALYAEAETEYAWLSAKTGLRYEHVGQSSHYKDDSAPGFDTKNGVLVPSASLTATLSESQTIGVTYNLRVRRPSIEELNPFVYRFDPLTLEYGNPRLDQERTHNISLSYMLNLQRLSMRAALTHQLTNDGIMQYSFQKEGKIHRTFGNIVRTNQTSANVYVSWGMTQTTKLLLNTELSYVEHRSSELDAKNHGWSLGSNIGVQQTLPWQLKFTTNLEYMSRSYTLQGWESGMTELTASISRSFMDDRWDIALTGTTGLGHGGDLVWTSYSKTSDFISTQSFTMPVQCITLGITYNFGGGKKESFEQSDLELPQKRNRRGR